MGDTSPYTRNPIVQIVEEKEKKQEILEFAKRVIQKKKKKKSKRKTTKRKYLHRINIIHAVEKTNKI